MSNSFIEHFIEQQINDYLKSHLIITKEQYDEMRSHNDERCLNLVRFHTNKDKGCSYMSTFQFQKLLVDTYNYHSAMHNYVTEQYSLSIDDAGFLVYVDVDYDMSDVNINTATQINDLFSNILTQEIGKMMNTLEIHENINILSFVPNQLESNEMGLIKGGVHIFIFFPYMLIGQDRQNVKAKILEIPIQNEQIKIIFNQYSSNLLIHGEGLPLTPESLIDPQPLDRYSSQIMPYTKKHWVLSKDPEPRNYRLSNICNTSGQEFSKLIIPPHSQASFNEIVVSPSQSSISNINYGNINFDSTQSAVQFQPSWATASPLPTSPNPSTNQQVSIDKLSISKRRRVFTTKIRNKFTNYHWTNTSALINQCCFMFDFCSSLAILEDSHPFLQMFQKGIWLGNKKSANKFINHIMNMYYIIFYLNMPIPPDFDKYLPELILDTIECLYIRGLKTNRDDVLNQITNYVNFCLEQRISQELVTENTENTENFQPNQIVQNVRRFYRYPNKYDILKDSQLHHYATTWGNVSKRSTIQKDSKQYFQEQWAKVLPVIDRMLNHFTAYIIHNIMEPMEKEIEPFSPSSYKRNVNEYSFKLMNNNITDKLFYIEQLQNFNKGLLFANLYQSSMKCYNKIVEDMVNAYTHHYIYCTTNNKIRQIYIYNIQQTSELESMPYNQWILDTFDALSSWTTHLLDSIFEPISKKEIYNGEGGINYMISLFADTYEIMEKARAGKEKAINALIQTNNKNNFKQEVKTNLIKHYSEMKDETIMVYPAAYQTEYFAVRNGILHFICDETARTWKVELLTDNHDKIIPSYSMAKYSSHYDKRNPYYDKVMKVLSDIYPTEEDREFILDFFSSTICPSIQKDNFLFMFGTGGDGKSTINTLLRCILGGQQELVCREEGQQIKLKNPCGYFGSMDSSTMTSKKQRGSADEGGTINLVNKTYAVMMEPASGKIRSETIKAWTGFGPIQARGIYKASQEVIVNCLIVCETNDQPNFDIMDEAMKRRIKIFYHQAKFINEFQKYRFKYADQRNIHTMDPDSINMIRDNVEYWEALLQILIEHALNLLNRGIKILSKIDPPFNVKQFTEASFKKSSSLSGWLENNIIRNEELVRVEGSDYTDIRLWGWLSANVLIDRIKRANKETRLLDAGMKNEKEMTEEIVKALDNTYGGCMFRINPELIKRVETAPVGNANIDIHKVENLIHNMSGITDEDIRGYINDYMIGGQSVRSMRESITTDSYSDIVILGISLADGNGVGINNQVELINQWQNRNNNQNGNMNVNGNGNMNVNMNGNGNMNVNMNGNMNMNQNQNINQNQNNQNVNQLINNINYQNIDFGM